MQLTKEMIINATTADEVAHVMRVLSEDVLEALRNNTMPNGNGYGVDWHHPCGAVALISEADSDVESTAYDVTISVEDICINGGFALFDEGAADMLDELIEGYED